MTADKTENGPNANEVFQELNPANLDLSGINYTAIQISWI